jgi:hypothetical protein
VHFRSNGLVDGQGPETKDGEHAVSIALTDEHLPPAGSHALHTRGPWGRPLLWELVGVFGLSLLLSILLFHRAWDWPFSTLVGSAGDADEYSWFLSWVPFAIGHGLDPLVSNYVNYPGGVNLMWNTSVLLPSFLMAPVTVIFGAAFSYNALVTLAPVLNATFAYLAFRRWTGGGPALVGALVFGFSPYIATQSVGHLAETLVLSAPLMLIIFDRLLVVQSKKPWVDGLFLGVLAWAQLLTGEEVLAMEAVTAAIALAVFYAIARHDARSHFGYALRGGLVGAGVFAVLSAPFLAVQYFGPYKVQDPHPRNVYVSDLLNFIIPTRVTELAPAAALRASSHFTGNGSEQSAYIGIPLLVFVILALVLARRRTVTWVALSVAVAAAVLSMGPALHVAGHRTHIDLPELLLKKLPAFHNLLPDRFASTMTLGAGLLVALGLEELKRLRRPAMVSGCALAGLGLVAIVPTFHFAASASPPLGAFNTGFSCPKTSAGVSPAGPADVMVLPAVNELNLRWQAESDFCFVMPTSTGMTGTNRRAHVNHGILFRAGSPSMPSPPVTSAARQQAAQEIQAFGVKEIIVAPQSPAQPLRSFQDEDQLVAWVEWLVGQAPARSHDLSVTYVWDDLPPAADISSGKVGTVPGEA